MISILRSLVVLFDTVLQILLRLGGMTRGEKINFKVRIERLEDAIDDKEKDDMENK
jgi:hypothetical protein